MICGPVESMWPPLIRLANTGVEAGSADSSAGHWGPDCSSCMAPDTNTWTVMRRAHVLMERWSKMLGSRPDPVLGATSWGPASDARLWDWAWRAWLARHVEPGPSAAIS